MPSAAPDPASRARFLADLDALLASAGLAADAPIGVALSGGPDSVALLLLAASAATGPVKAMTIDHGLRPDSADEAIAAGAVAAMIGVPHSIRRVSVAPAGDGVQGEARRARYAALGEWAAADGLAAILTAHHADDQAETMLMRLARGAGLSGLSGIRPARPLLPDSPLWLLRPLLGWRKAELEAIVAAAGIVPARDPSNANPRFGRTAARALLAATDWLDPVRLAATADHLRDADAALESATDAFYATAVSIDGEQATLRPDGAPREILRRALKRLFRAHFGARTDGPGLTRLMAVLAAGGTATLADIKGEGGPLWRFRRAPPRRLPHR
jgi:tRNA(Ile)-lysidine synthase